MMNYSCRQQPNEVNNLFTDVSPIDERFVTEVDVMVVEEGTFRRELISNGKLRASRKSRISFINSDILLDVFVKNGQHVEAGQVLAIQCSERLERQLERAAINKKQATLEMEYLLLGHGYTLRDSLSVPDRVWEMSGIRSGYLEARIHYKQLLSDFEKTVLTAPFSGIVAGIDATPYEHVTAGSIFCRLFDQSLFSAEFSIVEKELQMLSIGDKASITPFSNPGKTYIGEVISIEPEVDENGQILVTAVINDTGGLLEGMNVRVVVHHDIHNQIVVPISSVLYRDNMDVLFRYENGEAVWTYVSILHQNSTHYSVIARPGRVSNLTKGDTVIINGNMNLAHRSAVRIR